MSSSKKKKCTSPLTYLEGITIAKRLQSRLVADGTKINATIVGSLRRKAKFTCDIDLLICTTRKIDNFKINGCKYIEVVEQYADGDCKKSFIVKVNLDGKYRNVKVDIFFALPQNRAFALMHHTGGKIFNIKMRVHAKKMGLKLNQYGIFKDEKRAYGTSKIKTEKEIFKYFNIPYCSPAERAVYDK